MDSRRIGFKPQYRQTYTHHSGFLNRSHDVTIPDFLIVPTKTAVCKDIVVEYIYIEYISRENTSVAKLKINRQRKLQKSVAKTTVNWVAKSGKTTGNENAKKWETR